MTVTYDMTMELSWHKLLIVTSNMSLSSGKINSSLAFMLEWKQTILYFLFCLSRNIWQGGREWRASQWRQHLIHEHLKLDEEWSYKKI